MGLDLVISFVARQRPEQAGRSKTVLDVSLCRSPFLRTSFFPYSPRAITQEKTQSWKGMVTQTGDYCMN